jgi:signal transduction histidine kinase
MSQTIDELLHSTMSLHSDVPLDVVDTDRAMAEALDMVRPMAEQKKVAVTVAERLPAVLGDHARVREIFYNLLSNAVKFSDKRRGRVEVGCTARDDDCIFTIADNGPGIPAEELARVFVPFRRLPAHREIPGSGLGLYFAKTMVEQQEGSIWVESEVGAGSCFYVRLKLAAAADGR